MATNRSDLLAALALKRVRGKGGVKGDPGRRGRRGKDGKDGVTRIIHDYKPAPAPKVIRGRDGVTTVVHKREYVPAPEPRVFHGKDGVGVSAFRVEQDEDNKKLITFVLTLTDGTELKDTATIPAGGKGGGLEPGWLVRHNPSGQPVTLNVSSDTTIDGKQSKYVVLVDASGGDVTITLPTAVRRSPANDITVIRRNVEGGVVTVLPPAGETICDSTDGTCLNYSRTGNLVAIEFTPMGSDGWFHT